MTRSASARVIKNTAAGTVAQIIALLVGLITTPVILHSLGATEFGAYALIASLTTYFGLLDLGLGGSLTRFMAFYHQRNDWSRIGAFVSIGVLFYTAFALVGIPLLLAGAPDIGRFLGLPDDMQAAFPMLLCTVFVLFIGWSIIGILVGRLTAAHRLDLSAVGSIAGSMVLALLTFLIVPRFPGIETVFLCLLGQLATVIAVLLVFNLRLHGRLLTSLGHLDRREVRQLFSFGLWSQISAVTAVINLEADKVIISRYIGVSQVTPYQVANRLALISRALPLQLLGSLLPEVTSRVSAGAKSTEIRQIYASASRGLMIPTVFIAGFVVGSADPILRFWLHADLPGAATLCGALVLSYSVNNVTGVGTTIMRAVGRPQLETFYGCLSTVLNIALTIVLVPTYGLNGVVIGTIFGNVVGSIVFVALFHRYERISWWNTQGKWLLPIICVTALSSLLAYAMLSRLAAETLDRMQLGLALGLAGCVYCLAFGLLGRLAGQWRSEDRVLISKGLAKLRLPVKKLNG
jgi:O-antigen/teichoic acid export membrane protein